MGEPITRRQRRRYWLRRGIHALSCVVDGLPPDVYGCPLCLRLFTAEDLDDGVLTDEHVPPQAVGGLPLVLTCQECNGASGLALDRAVAEDEKVRTFGKPFTIGPLAGSVTVERVPNNGAIGFDGTRFVMIGHPGSNNPAVIEAHTAAMASLEEEGVFDLKITFKVDVKQAKRGWLRSAYLAAFAVYGYRYILQPAFQQVRQAIVDPDVEHEPLILEADIDAGPLDPLIAEVTEPAELAGCRAALFGPRLVLLPPWNASDDWYARLPDIVAKSGASYVKVRSVIGRRFPEFPMYLCDG